MGVAAVMLHLQKRVFQHKWKERDGLTARYNRDCLVQPEPYQDVCTAIAREKESKGWRRPWKIVLIEPTNLTWADLSRDWFEYEPADFCRVRSHGTLEATADPSLVATATSSG